MNKPTCPACRKNPCRRGQYLCRGCWYTLQPGTRRALNRCDDHAVTRLQQLHQALDEDIPLHEITIQ